MINRPIYRLNPQDIGQKRGIGISVLFNNDTSVFNQTFTTKEQVKSNLINYILTKRLLCFPLIHNLQPKKKTLSLPSNYLNTPSTHE